jgi:hypothetical protein
MKPVYRIYILTLFLLIQNSVFASDQFTIQVGTEGGYYNSQSLGDRLIMRLIGRLNYSNTFDQNFISIKTRLAPEVYGLNFSASTLKFNGQMFLGQRRNQFTWQARFATRNYFYKSDQFDDITFNVFQIGADLTKPVNNQTIIGLALDYYYRDSSHRSQSQLDNYSVSIFTSYQINRSNVISAELSLGSFKIHRRFQADSINANEGIRYGPKVTFNHRSGYILNFSYQLIRHSSDLLTKNHWENQLEFLWGKIFARSWSLFFYLNYLFLPDTEQEIPIELTYTPINNENWYHLKLGYDLSKTKEIYLKLGYTRDVLIYNNQDLAGWQFLAGIDFKI